jgi:hypothetical protein
MLVSQRNQKHHKVELQTLKGDFIVDATAGTYNIK